MFRLILNPESQSVVKSFDKDEVVIGSKKGGKADLFLDEDSIEDQHVAIYFADGDFVAHNRVHDPFATVNDVPFGKKTLKPGDRIQVGNTIFQFEEYVPLKEEEESPPKEEKDDSPSFEMDNGQFFLILSLVVAVLAIVIASSIYVNVNDRVVDEEILAAEGVSDIAMALAYAKLYHMTPKKQSFSDPGFLNKALHSVVASEFPLAARIDIHGKFADLPYILRIYTSNDLSQFLVIAQPVPSLLNWLVPKKTVIVDSATMEIRKMGNLRDLNRLLIDLNNPDVENDSSEVVTSYVKQETLIPLSAVAQKKMKKGFILPEALKERSLGAENLIYNAPRYYPFTEGIVDLALGLLETDADGKTLYQFKQLMEGVRGYPRLVFYSSKGLESVLEAKKAFSVYSGWDEEPLVGEVKLDEKGQIVASSLLDGIGEVSVEGGNHPLFKKLLTVVRSREEALQPVGAEMEELIHLQNREPVPKFWERFQKLMFRYHEEDLQQQKEMRDELVALNRKYHAVPFTEFLSFVKAAGLEGVLEGVESSMSPEEFEEALQRVEGAVTLLELYQKVDEVSALLTLERVDPNDLAAYQNAFRALVTDKLSAFSDDSRSEFVALIQSAAWIED